MVQIGRWNEEQLTAYFLCSYCLGLLMASATFSQLCSRLASQLLTAPTTLHPTPPTQSPTWRPLSTPTQLLTQTTPQEAPHPLYRSGLWLHIFFCLLICLEGKMIERYDPPHLENTFSTVKFSFHSFLKALLKSTFLFTSVRCNHPALRMWWNLGTTEEYVNTGESSLKKRGKNFPK